MVAHSCCTKKSAEASAAQTWKDTEEFIEDKFQVDIRYQLKIDCEVMQRGFRKFLLRNMLGLKIPLRSDKKLKFWVSELPQINGPFLIYWKVLNRGDEARRRDCVRGQITLDGGWRTKRKAVTFEEIISLSAISSKMRLWLPRIEFMFQS